MTTFTSRPNLRTPVPMLILVVFVTSAGLTAPIESAEPLHSAFNSIAAQAVWSANGDCSSARNAVKAVRDKYRNSRLRIVFIKADGEGGHIIRVNDGQYIWDVRVSIRCTVTEMD